MHLQELPVGHFFGDGVYVRELRIPAGAWCFGRVQRLATVLIFAQGEMMMVDESGTRSVVGPTVIVSPAGAQRVGYAVSNCVFYSAHPNADECRDVPALLERLTLSDSESWSHLIERKLLL